MKWKIDKKYISIAVLALIVILVSIVFNNILEHGTQYKQIRATLKNTFMPILLGFVLAYLMNPILNILEDKLFTPLAGLIYPKPGQEKKKKSTSRALGVITTIAIFLLLLVGGLCMVIPQVYTSVEKIVGDLPGYYRELENWIYGMLSDENEMSTYIMNVMDNLYIQLWSYINTTVVPNMDKIVKGITTGIIEGFKILMNLILAIIISIYVLCEKENLISFVKKLTYSYLSVKKANQLVTAVRYVHVVFGGFINGKIIDSFIIGILCYVCMLILRLEYAVLISIIVGVTNVIPYFGPFIGAIPSGLLLLMAEPRQGLIFAVFVLVLQQLDGNVIGPLILGDRLKISSMWILFAILIGGGLYGVPGMILGAPTLACIYALLGKDSRRRLEKRSLPTESADYLMLDHIPEDQSLECLSGDKEKSR